MGISFAHLVVLLVIIFILFGAGKLPKVMSDLGKGIKNLKKELEDEKRDILISSEKKEEKFN